VDVDVPQYGHMYPTYPYAMPPNAGYHYMHSPYSHYPQAPGAAYAAQAGAQSTYAQPGVAAQYAGAPGGPGVKYQVRYVRFDIQTELT